MKTVLDIIFAVVFLGCGLFLAGWLLGIVTFADVANIFREPKNLSFTCEQPLPEFTLGPYSEPGPAELSDLCECVWEHLSASEHEISRKVRNNTGTVSEADARTLASAFGEAMDECGGYEF